MTAPKTIDKLQLSTLATSTLMDQQRFVCESRNEILRWQAERARNASLGIGAVSQMAAMSCVLFGSAKNLSLAHSRLEIAMAGRMFEYEP